MTLSGNPCIPGLFGGARVAGGAWLGPAAVHLQEPGLPPPLPTTGENTLPDASKINYRIKIARFKSFILCY